jgi:penicillin-binding protein 2
MNSFRNRPLDDEFLRIRIVLVCMLLALTVLGSRLWYLQVAHGHRFEKDQTRQSVRRVRIPGVRGRIFDRHDVCLADNRPSYCIAAYLEELRQPGNWSKTIDRVEKLIADLGGEIGLDPVVTRADIQLHIRKRLPLPFVLWRDVDEATLARFVETASGYPGVDIYTEAVRSYPLHGLAAHVIGYVGRADLSQEDADEPYHYYLPDMTGRAGVEKSLDPHLRGDAGGRLMRIDVSGYRRHDVGQREPRPGADVRLALDARIQRIAEEALGDTAGSAVVLDPTNGDILAMVSSPAYDLNAFIPSITRQTWKALQEDPLHPLLNRAISGAYAPGSTFKVVTALAGLEAGSTDPRDSYVCPGYFRLGSAVFRCWFHAGHGTVSLHEALQRSCNVYFFHVGLKCGDEPIARIATDLGLGRKTGIELEGERAGLVPDSRWKKLFLDDAWRDGDTCNVSIGQGALAVTPLQLALMTSTIANGGTLYRPRLVKAVREGDGDAFAEQPVSAMARMPWKPEHLRQVREGMRDVVMTPQGTGKSAAVPGISVAGKTGTAEFGRKEDRRRHAWMIAFAPYDAPRYAVALLVDEGVSGGETAAPRMGHLLRGIFAPEDERGDGVVGHWSDGNEPAFHYSSTPIRLGDGGGPG